MSLSFQTTTENKVLHLRFGQAGVRNLMDDAWFDAPINNAKLAATAVYSDRVPAFLRLFDLCSGDYPRFYEAVRRIGALGSTGRVAALETAKTCE